MLLVRAADWTICTCTNIKTTALFVPFIWWNCHVLFSVQMHSRALVMTTLLFLIAKCILIHDNNEWWHATPDVTTLMFSVHFGWFYFNVMITLYLSIYISERKHVKHIWRCCCTPGESRTWPQRSSPIGCGQAKILDQWGGVAEPRGGERAKAVLPCSSSNGRWEIRYHQLCFSPPSPSYVDKTSTVKTKKRKKETYSESAIPPKIQDLFHYGLL